MMARVRVGYREQSQDGARLPRGRLRYSDVEWAAIVVAAAVAGMAPNAWAQQAAFEAAVRANQGVPSDRNVVLALVEELRQHRRVLTNIGGNLNDVARVANSTGEVPTASAVQTMLRVVGHVVRDSDTVVRDIHARLLP